MNLLDLFVKITVDDSDVDSGFAETGSKAESLAGKLKGGLTAAAKASAAAITAASAAVGALVKNSVDSYAEYEQLVGGVETLFKTSSDTVMQYAQNAYQTAGMSANEYMTTVTAFSASLLQSMGNDTEAAAEKANLAITDMSDNANKMGSTMESIQYAYSGFAKQNYTMLDNLKLGYGGTKEEMQRLLSDAQKISGIKYDLSSYADIVDAIHVVQTEMGITGTTAQEASTTIQGSVSAMKAAWQNLVTGFGDESADLNELIGNVVDSAETAAGNIIPRITQILAGMGTAIEQIAPVLAAEIPGLITGVLPSIVSAGAQLIVGLATGLVSAAPGLVSAVPEIINTLITAISANGPALLESGNQLLSMLTDGILIGVPELLAALPDVLIAIIGFFEENISKWLEAGFQIIEKLAFGIIEAIPQLAEKLPEVIKAITRCFTTAFPQMIEKGGELLGKLLVGILAAIPEIWIHIPEVILAIAQAIESGWEVIKDAGSYLLEGLWEGIKDKVEWLKSKVTDVIDIIKGWFTGKDGFDEHSPSKWSKGVFRYVMEGGSDGLESGLPGLMRSVDGVIGQVKGGMDFGVANVDFASSGVGMSSAAIVNGLSFASANGGIGNATFVLQLEDGSKIASWLLSDLIKAAAANGTPIAGGQYA